MFAATKESFVNDFIELAGGINIVKDLSGGLYSREKVIDLYNSIYSTNNMIFCVVGKTNWQDVLNEAKKFPKTNREIRNIPIIPKNGELVEKRKGIDLRFS